MPRLEFIVICYKCGDQIMVKKRHWLAWWYQKYILRIKHEISCVDCKDRR